MSDPVEGRATYQPAEEKNTFLLLIRLDLAETNPLGQPLPGAQGLRTMDDDKSYSFIAGLLDASKQATRAPLMAIPFNAERKELYNGIISRFEKVIKKFYDEDHGLVSFPERFDSAAQAEVDRDIGKIGRDICDLFPRPTPLSNWLDKILKGERSWLEHVTIITNDFNVPWYWMKNTYGGTMLCEECGLGMLQLSSRSFAEPDDDRNSDIAGSSLRGLLINGSGRSNLPFSSDQLSSLMGFLQTGKDLPTKRRLLPFEVNLVTNGPELRGLREDLGTDDTRGLYRLVHYSGHWNYESTKSEASKTEGGENSKKEKKRKELWVGDKPTSVADLKDFVESAVLALDGCSSSHGLQAWAEVENLTGTIINLGALGCVVTTLPVKDDPILSGKFWESFYGNLLREVGSKTLGQALRTARATLREHLGVAGSKNPSWAFYQLIGNPSVRLIDEGPMGASLHGS